MRNLQLDSGWVRRFWAFFFGIHQCLMLEKKKSTRSRLRYVKFDRDVGHQMEGPGPNQPQSKHALTAEPDTLWFSNYPKQDFAWNQSKHVSKHNGTQWNGQSLLGDAPGIVSGSHHHISWRAVSRNHPKDTSRSDTITYYTGWWFQPTWKILVRWDDYSQYMEK
jgi:hypothetical protein